MRNFEIKAGEIAMIDDNDPLWFLKHNPRAYNEVVDWITNKTKEIAANNNVYPKISDVGCCLTNSTLCILNELLQDLTYDLKPSSVDDKSGEN